MSVFRTLIGGSTRSPGWMRRSEDAGILEPIGNALDHFFALDTYRLLAGLPGYSTDASLREIGRDRHVLLFPQESRAAQIQRTREWIPAYEDAGLPVGVLRQGQLLWLPELPRVRIVAGNSEQAMWTTIDALVDGSYLAYFAKRDASNGGSNWDWASEYYADAAVPGDEPLSIHNFWIIIYAPPSVVFPPASPVPQDPLISIGSSITVRFALNLVGIAEYWTRKGSRLAGIILASDSNSFDPMGDNISIPGGYPDGTWWRSAGPSGPNRLTTARYYAMKEPVPVP